MVAAKSTRTSASKRAPAKHAAPSRSARSKTAGAPSAHAASTAPADPRSKAELYAEAKALGIAGRGRMSKADLARAVDEAKPSGWARPVAAVESVAESVVESVAPVAQRSVEVAKPVAVKSIETAKVLVHDAGEIASDLQERGASLLHRVLPGSEDEPREA